MKALYRDDVKLMHATGEHQADPLGRVCLQCGFVTRKQLAMALKKQKYLDLYEGRHVLIGMLMIEMGYLTTAQLIQTLRMYERKIPAINLPADQA